MQKIMQKIKANKVAITDKIMLKLYRTQHAPKNAQITTEIKNKFRAQIKTEGQKGPRYGADD